MQRPFLVVGAVVVIGVFVVLGAFVWHYHGPDGIWNRNTASNFEECAAAGNPVGESYPRQCWTPDGRHFVEEIVIGELPAPGPIIITGEIACLPKVGSGAQTLECAIGLKGLDGRYYALKNLFELDPHYTFSAGGTNVEVAGTVTYDEMKGPDGKRYDIAGVIALTAIRGLENSDFKTSGTLVGRISVGPLCPVEPCQGEVQDIYSGLEVIAIPKGGGRPVDLPFSISVLRDGTFREELPEGDYELTVHECKWLGCAYALPKLVRIDANRTVEIQIDIDTGIR